MLLAGGNPEPVKQVEGEGQKLFPEEHGFQQDVGGLAL